MILNRQRFGNDFFYPSFPGAVQQFINDSKEIPIRFGAITTGRQNQVDFSSY